jgi:hypothetical protein
MADKKEKLLNIHQRIHAIMEDVKYVQKEEKKVNNQYKFVSHDAVTKVVREALVKHGVLAIPDYYDIAQDGNRTSCHVSMQYINKDNPEDSIIIRCAGFGYGIDGQDKGPGKAMSYAYKYALLKMFALETGDDPERDQIDHKIDSMAAIAQEYKATKDKMKNNIMECKEIRDLNKLWLNGSSKLNAAHKIKMYELYTDKYNELAEWQDTDSASELRRMDIDDKR